MSLVAYIWRYSFHNMQDTNSFTFDSRFFNMRDEDLIEEIRLGNLEAQNYLLQKYKSLVSVKSKRFFIVGAENDDIVQEGMIGLYKAIRSFDSSKDNSFKTFANICIERQLITAIKTSNRQKHIPLNTSFSLDNTAYEENDDVSIMDILNTNIVEDPLEMITKKENTKILEKKIDENLSKFEKKVLEKYLEGYSYDSIASILNTSAKSVDNAIQRIRKKAIKNIMDT